MLSFFVTIQNCHWDLILGLHLDSCISLYSACAKMVQGSVARFRKLVEEGSLTEKIYSCSRSINYIHTTVLSLSRHWPGNKGIYFKDFYEKREKLVSHSLLSECSQDLLIQKENYFWLNSLQIWLTHGNIHNLLFKDQHPNFSKHHAPLTWSFFPLSHPVSENEFGFIGAKWRWT